MVTSSPNMEYVMNPVKTLLLASTMIATSALAAHADVKVVTSIKPVHSLVASVMQGVGEPSLIVDGAASPHNYALKPSQAQMLEQADVVFWVGHELEAFLEKPLETVGAKAKSVELIDAHDLVKLGYREGGAFEAHGHDDEAAHGHGHDHDNKAEAEQT
jgi:zinc transport system substrate-binding protein